MKANTRSLYRTPETPPPRGSDLRLQAGGKLVQLAAR